MWSEYQRYSDYLCFYHVWWIDRRVGGDYLKHREIILRQKQIIAVKDLSGIVECTYQPLYL